MQDLKIKATCDTLIELFYCQREEAKVIKQSVKSMCHKGLRKFMRNCIGKLLDKGKNQVRNGIISILKVFTNQLNKHISRSVTIRVLIDEFKYSFIHYPSKRAYREQMEGGKSHIIGMQSTVKLLEQYSNTLSNWKDQWHEYDGDGI